MHKEESTKGSINNSQVFESRQRETLLGMSRVMESICFILCGYNVVKSLKETPYETLQNP